VEAVGEGQAVPGLHQQQGVRERVDQAEGPREVRVPGAGGRDGVVGGRWGTGAGGNGRVLTLLVLRKSH